MKIAVYCPNWIGDAVMAIPFIQELKKHNPKAKIFVICKSWVSGIFENHELIDQIISISDNELSSISGTIKAGLKLRAMELDSAYTLTDSFRSAFILWLSGSKKRFGYNTQMRSFLLTDSKRLSHEIIHRSKKYLRLLEIDSDLMVYPKLYFTPSEKKWAKKEMMKIGFKNPVGILPYSVGKNRTLPNEVLKKWIKGSKNNYLVFGSKKDSEKSNNLIKSCKKNSIKSICGEYTLRQSMVLLNLCNFTLCADSGLGHISASLGIPTISFFGVGNKEVTAPLGKKTYVIKHCVVCKEEECSNENQEMFCIKKITKIDIENSAQNIFFSF